MVNFACVALWDRAKSKDICFDRKDAHRQMTQIGVIGSSRTLTGSRLATKPILAKSVIWLAGKSQKRRPPNIKKTNLKK